MIVVEVLIPVLQREGIKGDDLTMVVNVSHVDLCCGPSFEQPCEMVRMRSHIMCFIEGWERWSPPEPNFKWSPVSCN